MTYTPHVWSRHDKLDSAALNGLEQAVGAFSGTADQANAAAASANTAASNAAASATAATNAANLVGAPADAAIGAAVNGAGSATQKALDATRGPLQGFNYGLVADAVEVSGLATTASAKTVTGPAGTFASSRVGNTIGIYAPGVLYLVSTISAISTDGATATLAATVPATSTTVTARFGTDNTAALQSLLSDSKAKRTTARIPSGSYITTSCLQAGVTSGFGGCTVQSDGAPYDPAGAFIGPTIYPLHTDQPALNFAGGRNVRVQGIAIRGWLSFWIAAKNLAPMPVEVNSSTGSAPLIDDTVRGNWSDPILGTNIDSRYAPYAAVTVDAFAGGAPSPAYRGSYGASASSQCVLRDARIDGFVAGFVNQPGSYDSNGDYTTLENVKISNVVWAVSVGNSQSRAPRFKNLQISTCFTAFASNVHGKQVGRLGGEMDSISCDYTINLFSVVTSATGPTTVTNLSAELVWSVGMIGAGGASATPWVFRTCKLNLNLQQALARGVPAYTVASDSLNTTNPVTFEACSIIGFYRFFMCQSFATRLSGGTSLVSALAAGGTISTPSDRYAHNVTCGGFVMNNAIGVVSNHDILHTPRNLDTGAASAPALTGSPWAQSSRTGCIPAHVTNVQPASQIRQLISNTTAPLSQSKGSFTLSLSGRVLTITWSARSAAALNVSGGMPGDLIIDQPTGTVFVVTSTNTSTGTITATAWNNIKSTDGGTTWSFVNAVATTNNGTMFIVNSRYFTPTYVTFGTISTTAATISSVGRADTYAAYLNTDVLPNDYAYVDTVNDPWVSLGNSLITAVDGTTAKTITLAANLARNATGRPFTLFVKQAPTS